MNIVSISGRVPDATEPRFFGSGLLLDACHVLTAMHVWNDAARYGAAAWIALLPDCGEPLEAEFVERHLTLDACLLRVKDWQAPDGLAYPRLLDDYQPLNEHAVVLRAVTPTMPRVVSVPLTVTAFDNSTLEYEVSPAVAQGNSGGAVVHDDVVIGLMTRRVENQPIARFLSLHALAPWIRQATHPGPRATAPSAIEEPTTPFSPPGVPGLSHRIGSIHLHVDGARARAFIDSLVTRHSNAGIDAELAWVTKAIAGPQRDDLRRVYDLHDPVELDFFSTTQLHAGPGLPNQAQRRAVALEVHDILCELCDQGEDAAGTVIELERVVGTVDAHGQATMAADLAMRGTSASIEAMPALQLFAPFNTRDLKPAGSERYELHFSLDLPKKTERAPVALDDLKSIAAAAGIELGGWFLFHDERRWAFRSNAFVWDVSPLALQSRWQRLQRELKQSPIAALHEFTLRLVAEETLAVWRTPLVLTRNSLLPVSGLVSWERSFDGLKEFWVLLPNFLGDQLDEMRLTMESNLNRGVRYIYFLASNADAKRWLNFRADLESRVARAEDLMTAYVVAFAPGGPLFNFAAFIANPRSNNAKGYELTVDASTNRVLFGSEMERLRIDEVASALLNATSSSAVTDWHLVQSTASDVTVTAVCVKLIDDLDDDALEALLDRLDNGLALLASQHGGSVELYGGRSITVVFVGNRPQLGLALQFVRKVCSSAERTDGLGLQCAIRVGMAYGAARLTARASGRIWTGPAIRASNRVLDKVERRVGVFVAAGADGTKPPFEPQSVELSECAPGAFEMKIAATTATLPSISR